MKFKNRITNLLEIEKPVIQGGMVWASGWKLVSAVSNCGGLGLIGAGSMKPPLLEEHILKTQKATDKSFGVNIPLLRQDAEELVDVVIKNNVKIVFTSAGHPGKFIDKFKLAGIKVVHVVPAVKFGLKAESVGCDAIVGEGVEAGGHNGADEITTMALIPQLVDAVKIPVIAAGGIATGRQILSALALGAEGVQIGTAFAATKESGLHNNYKQKILEASDNSTILILKKLGMARALKTDFALKLLTAEQSCIDKDELREMLGKKKEMIGMFEGNLNDGIFEAGQSSGLINEIVSVKDLFASFENDFNLAFRSIYKMQINHAKEQRLESGK